MAFVFAALLVVALSYHRSRDLGACVVWSVLVLGVLVTIVCECLSALSILNPFWVNVIWGGGAMAALVILVRKQKTKFMGRRDLLDALPRARHIFVWLFGNGVSASIVLISLALSLAFALAAPPNSWDAMTYHLPRIHHWLMRESVAFYPTHIHRQLWMAPLSEYFTLHLQVGLFGSRAAAVLQWLAMVVALVLVAEISRALLTIILPPTFPPTLMRGGWQLALLFAVTLPMGILQASNGQNDLFASVWLLTAIWCLLKEPDPFKLALGVGISAGCGVFSKGVHYVYFLPVAIFLFVRLVGMQGWWGAMRLQLFSGAAVVALNGLHWWRNLKVFANPLGSISSYPLVNELDGQFWSATFSNIIRNLSSQLTVPWIQVTSFVRDGAVDLLGLFGLDANDPATTYIYARFAVSNLWNHPDYAGNPLHLLALLVAGSLLCFMGVGKKMTAARYNPALTCSKDQLDGNLEAATQDKMTPGILGLYAAGLILAFALFCLAFRWQPWHSRLLLPLFFAAAPLWGAFCHLQSWRVLAAKPWIGLFCLGAIPVHLCHFSHPLFDTNLGLAKDQWGIYTFRPELRRDYEEAIKTIGRSGCKVVGFYGYDDAWEYPLWHDLSSGTEIRHIQVTNSSGSFQASDESDGPCMVFAASGGRFPGYRMIYSGEFASLWAR